MSPPDLELAQGNTQAREEAPETTLKIIEIMGLLAAFKFRRGSTVRRLAKKWNLSDGYVHQLATEARKRIRAQLTDPNEIASEVIPGLLVAFRKVAESDDPKMLSSAAGIAGQLAKLANLNPAEKHELTGAGGLPLVTGVVILPIEDPEGTCDAQPDDAADPVEG